MKIFDETVSEYLGYLIAVILSLILTRFIALLLDVSNIIYIILYFISYFAILYLCNKAMALSYIFVLNKKYKTSIFILLFVCWMNISYSIKFIQILIIFIQDKNIKKIQKYFNDKDEKIQYLSLCLYAYNYDINPVIKWFEDTYISKNLPIDSNFYPLYVDISTPNIKG